MAQLMSHHVRRQTTTTSDTSADYCSWWYCDPTAYIIKWVIVGVLFVAFLAFVLGGAYHAKRRMRRGQPPLRYHRWLISRQQRERFFPQHHQHHYGFSRPTYVPGGNGQPAVYPLQNYGYSAPPPAYHEAEAVPVYTPPTKVNPDQSYAAPPGAPPAQHQAGGSNYLNASGPSQPPRAASPYQNTR